MLKAYERRLNLTLQVANAWYTLSRLQIGQRLKQLREAKDQAGCHRKTHRLLRCYVSRVENGHTVPSVDSLQRWRRALEERFPTKAPGRTSMRGI
jgi:transcriptional regulator with XRE-family HTH domain